MTIGMWALEVGFLRVSHFITFLHSKRHADPPIRARKLRECLLGRQPSLGV